MSSFPVAIRESILQMTPYHPPLENRDPRQHLLFDFNEFPVAVPQQVVDAITDFAKSGCLQAYPAYGDFLQLLEGYTQVSASQLMTTNGSDHAIEIILRSILEEGTEIIMAEPGFSMFRQIASTLGAKMVSPAYGEQMAFPFQTIVDAANENTRVIVVINPNNPTGTSASLSQIEELLQRFPNQVVLVDEAYFEFTQTTAAPLLPKYPNLVITRTFSKALGIPSLRLGYVMAHPFLIEQYLKIRGPYDVNMMAIVAAKAQLENPEPWQEVVSEIMNESKPMVESFLREQQVSFYPSDANFMLVAPPNPKKVMELLAEHQVLVRPMKPPIAHMFRMSFGTVQQTKQWMSLWKKYIQPVM